MVLEADGEVIGIAHQIMSPVATELGRQRAAADTIFKLRTRSDVMAVQLNQSQATEPDALSTSRNSTDFVVFDDTKPPPRIELGRERMLLCRLYLGLIQTMNDDYGAEFAKHSDSATYRTIGIYVFLRTLMCSPVRASTIAQVLKIPRATVLRRLNDMEKLGYVEHVGNAYRMTDKVNIPDLKQKLQKRIDMILMTARELSNLGIAHSSLD
jgi:DNA-binding MarR family transcriptional regulator